MEEIEKLHIEMDSLQAANEKYKDKCLKAKILTEKKSKK
jgi:hypothetical protein